MKAILAILCVYAVFRSTETADGGMMCVYKGVQLSLDDAIHVSDVVFTGRILAMREGSRGTLTATVSYYFAYKRDQYLRKPGFGLTDVENFATSHAHMSGESGLFFLVREPSRKLALHCIAPLLSPQEMGPFENILEALDHVNKVGKEDNERNEKFVPPDPNPCDSILTNHCSREGSQCSVMNTLPGEEYRCTCLTGYVGNGVNCTGVETLPTDTPTTPPNYECPQCSYGGLCQNPTQFTSCDCSLIQCTDDQSTPRVCGSDGVTYGSLCKLQLEACLIQQPVFLLHEGGCDLQDVRPCGGISAPLTNQTAVVQCGDCPPMYFCHTTDLYSVCCLLEVMPPTSHIATIVTTTRPTAGTQSSSSFIPTMTTTTLLHTTSPMPPFLSTNLAPSSHSLTSLSTVAITSSASSLLTLAASPSPSPLQPSPASPSPSPLQPSPASTSPSPLQPSPASPSPSPLQMSPASPSPSPLQMSPASTSFSLQPSPASPSSSLQLSPASPSPSSSLQPSPASPSSSLQPSPASPSPSPSLQPSPASTSPSLQPSPASPSPSPSLQPSPASASPSLQQLPASTSSSLQPSPASTSSSLQPSPASTSSSLQPSPASPSSSLQPSPTETIDMSGSGDDVMIMSGDFSGGSGFIASGDDGSGSGDAGSGSEVGSEVIGFEDTLVDDEDWFAQRKRQRRGLRHHNR